MNPATRFLDDCLRPSRLTAMVDIGANPIDGDPPYRAMLLAGRCTVVGFEPQPEALQSLLARKGPLETYLPDAVGDGATHTLHHTLAGGMTSLLQPDPHQLALFNGFEQWGQVRQQSTIATRRLDDIREVGAMDLLKIDVQGAELMVFGGAPQRLAQAVAVHTEVSFVPLYRDQPSLGDVDRALRVLGFVPHCFAQIKRWTIAPLVIENDIRKPLRQLLEADMVYVRDFARLEQVGDEPLMHLARIADGCYGSFDLAHRCLMTLAERGVVAADAPDGYLQRLRPARP